MSPASPVSSVGIVVPRHQHTAVDRNQLTRRLRELVRIELLPALRDADVAVNIAIRARREAYSADLAGLRADILAIAGQLASRGETGG